MADNKELTPRELKKQADALLAAADAAEREKAAKGADPAAKPAKKTARKKAETMLNSGWYSYAGTDCHRPGDLRRLMDSRLDKKIFEPLERLIQNQVI